MPDTPKYGHEPGEDPDAGEAPPFNGAMLSPGLISGPGFHVGDLLTEQEREVVKMAGDLWNALCGVVGRGSTREEDCREMVAHVHALQHAVMAQAAARAYPQVYRLLGDSLREQMPLPEPAAAERPQESLRDYWTTGAGSRPMVIPFDNMRRLDEDVAMHAMGPTFEHEDGRVCSWHNRLGLWVGPTMEHECTREHPDPDDLRAKGVAVMSAYRKDKADRPEDSPPRTPADVVEEVEDVVRRVLGAVIADEALTRIRDEVRPVLDEYTRVMDLRHRFAEPKGARLTDVNVVNPDGTTHRLNPDAAILIFEDPEHGRTSIPLTEHRQTGKVIRGDE